MENALNLFYMNSELLTKLYRGLLSMDVVPTRTEVVQN